MPFAGPQRLPLAAGRAAPSAEVPAQAAFQEATSLGMDLSHFSLCF